jgi:16S rRNA (cytidine1402-2'-O)-methyltransferase
VVPLPGATAIIPALTGSGLPTDRFFFEGFLPHKSAARRKRLKSLQDLEHTLVFFESPHRLEKTLRDIQEVLGEREICLAREMTKMYEEFIRGLVTEVLGEIKRGPIKGELVIVVAGKIGEK